MRLIDADALKEELAKRTPHFAQRIKFTPCFEAIRNAPTVDAVAVVRCRDCKHQGDDESCPVCNECGRKTLPNGDWFCADGERREEDDLLTSANHDGERKDDDDD